MDGLALAAFLLAYSNLLNLWPPFNGAFYVPFNITTAGLLCLVALGPLELTRSQLGLADASLAEILVTAAGGILVTVPLFVAVRAGKGLSFLADERVRGLWGRSLLYQALIRVPFGTALLEELAFRGVLLASWRHLGTCVAVIASSVVFGLWHISPTLNLVRANHPDATGRRTLVTVSGAIVITALAGAGLGVLRVWTGSLFVPLTLHAAVNSFATVAGALAHRRRGG